MVFSSPSSVSSWLCVTSLTSLAESSASIPALTRPSITALQLIPSGSASCFRMEWTWIRTGVENRGPSCAPMDSRRAGGSTSGAESAVRSRGWVCLSTCSRRCGGKSFNRNRLRAIRHLPFVPGWGRFVRGQSYPRGWWRDGLWRRPSSGRTFPSRVYPGR